MTRDEIMAMDGDALRLAVAKALGEISVSVPSYVDGVLVGEANFTFGQNYPRDIAAAYALEDALPVERRTLYTAHLIKILEHNTGQVFVNEWYIAHASAADRCRAWLMTMEE